LGEHQLCKLGVAGSSPARSISIHRRLRRGLPDFLAGTTVVYD